MIVHKRESGQATIIMALFMGIVMIGFMGLCLDVGYFFQEKRMAQAAADAAAVAAAEEDSYAGDSGNAQTAANEAATENGFDTTLATNPATVTLNVTGSGNYSSSSSAAPSNFVTATVTQAVPTFFLKAFNPSSPTMTITASASAGEGATSPTCICLEGSSGMDLNMSNNAKLVASGCGVTVNSTSSNAVGVVGSATVTALSLGTVSSSWDNSSNINNNGSIASSTDIVLGISTSCSPTLPTVPSDTRCSADPLSSVTNGGSSYTVGPNSTYGTTVNGNTICYNSLSVNSNGDTVTLNAGIYVINGGTLHFYSGTNGGGTGVFFYLENSANVVIDNGANVKISAPTSGTYSGVLLFQDPSDSKAVSIQGGSSAVITGSIYAPAATVTLGNGSGTSITSGITAQSLTMNGGGTLNSSSSSNMGTLNISSATLSQ